ncbi:short-chain dehydrogenase [Bdellovibrionota bacterium FG-2]
MDIAGSRILILGGPGLVGMAVVRRFLFHKPESLVITALTKAEVDSALKELEPVAGKTKITGKWGNVFVRSEFKDLSRAEILGNPARLSRFVLDTLEPLNDEILNASTLYDFVKEYKPHTIIDCINTATALAYQDVFETSRQTYAMLKDSTVSSSPEFKTRVETLLGTQYTPQLIRHIQILWESLTDVGVQTYLKVGTTGTGGMGLNIPYTHSEDKPSRVLLAKSAIAGAQTMLLFLLGRTAREHGSTSQWSPDRNIKAGSPIIKEVKPAAAIGWKEISFGRIRRKGKPVELFDQDPSCALGVEEILAPRTQTWKRVENDYLQAPFIDTGENGIFSRGEFEAITDEGQMEFITPEEIAETVEAEIMGGNSGSDCVSALDSVVLGPTYRAGFLRARAVEKLRQLEDTNGVPSVAFENLGPPRLSKLLFELHLITQEMGLLEAPKFDAAELGKRCEERILKNAKLRAAILSVGIAIVLRNGRVLRGPELVIPSRWDIPKDGVVGAKHLDQYAAQGWLDLREANMKSWLTRLAALRDEAMRADNENTGSAYVRNRTHWETVAKQGSLGSVVSWVFLREEDGERVKR